MTNISQELSLQQSSFCLLKWPSTSQEEASTNTINPSRVPAPSHEISEPVVIVAPSGRVVECLRRRVQDGGPGVEERAVASEAGQSTRQDADEVPSFDARRLLLVGTGGITVTFLPFWLNWLSLNYPRLELQVAITRSAERFVTRASLTAALGRQVFQDAWPDDPAPGARHVEFARWPEAIAVFPATMHFLARLALGLADTPVLLALQCTRAPIGLAPALPPGGWESPAVRHHLQLLEQRRNVVIAPPRPGRSVTTGDDDAFVPIPFPTLMRLLELRRRALLEASND
jgi:phosphopantothenoylcysteine decarboxylase / phosphopantothenate---cysteine ligase